MNIFPNDTVKIENIKKGESEIINSIFGNRFKADQTMYEYLVEFLLVFSSAKSSDLETGKYQFHQIPNGRYSYWVEPRMGLRRFIFFDRSKRKNSIPADETAYNKFFEIVASRMDGVGNNKRKEYIESIQDLFHGYAVVVKKRFWGAQVLLPICKEFILCGCDPNVRQRRSKVNWNEDPELVDTSFEFSQRNFLARGGELYYLHLLQGLNNNIEKKEKLESLLTKLILKQCTKISEMASFLQQTWEEEMGFDKDNLYQQMNIAYIPECAYKNCENYSIDELLNYLSCEMHPINKVDILAKGIMFQIMRMMSTAISNYLNKEPRKWIIDMCGNKTSDNIRKLSTESLRNLSDDFITALNNKAIEIGLSGDDRADATYKARKNSWDIFKSKGKELQCIIPRKGANERFSLSEDILRFLVLSIIPPKKKMTLDMFLDNLYKHYGIIIGPNEYKISLEKSSNDMSDVLANSFAENLLAFQAFLKSTGFLKELSDATSIVINPYTEIK